MRLEPELPVWNARTSVKALSFTSGGLYLLPSFLRVWFLLWKLYNRVWAIIDLTSPLFSSWQTRQHVLLYLSDKYDKEKCHAERALAISCTRPVFLKREEPQVPRCPFQSFITTAAVHGIPERPRGVSGILWMKIRQCEYRSLDAEPKTSSLCLFPCSRDGRLAIQCLSGCEVTQTGLGPLSVSHL